MVATSFSMPDVSAIVSKVWSSCAEVIAGSSGMYNDGVAARNLDCPLSRGNSCIPAIDT
jgi:hypothetical protein